MFDKKIKETPKAREETKEPTNTVKEENEESRTIQEINRPINPIEEIINEKSKSEKSEKELLMDLSKKNFTLGANNYLNKQRFNKMESTRNYTQPKIKESKRPVDKKFPHNVRRI